jgi:hypothetical protein
MEKPFEQGEIFGNLLMFGDELLSRSRIQQRGQPRKRFIFNVGKGQQRTPGDKRILGAHAAVVKPFLERTLRPGPRRERRVIAGRLHASELTRTGPAPV